jgi:predicted dehydrogenase
LEYPGATGIIEASWNWPYTIMDVEVYGKTYLHAAEMNGAAPVSLQSKNETETKAEEISGLPYKDEVAYLTAVILQSAPDKNQLMSLEHNLIVVRILDAARRSVKEGRKVIL